MALFVNNGSDVDDADGNRGETSIAFIVILFQASSLFCRDGVFIPVIPAITLISTIEVILVFQTVVTLE